MWFNCFHILILYHLPLKYSNNIFSPNWSHTDKDWVIGYDASMINIHKFTNTWIFDIVVNGIYAKSFPSYYLNHIQHFLWRKDGIRIVLYFFNSLSIHHGLWKNLEIVLWYTDEVYSCLVAEIPLDIDRNFIYCSWTFESYWNSNILLVIIGP